MSGVNQQRAATLHIIRRRSACCAALTIFLAFAPAHAAEAVAQLAITPVVIKLPDHVADKSLGVASCANSLCHGAVESWKESPILQNEYVTWSRSDKHARAQAVLRNPLSREIATKLGLKQPPEKAALCLDCHAHNTPPERRKAGFVLADGVGCEACHGPAERWISHHVEPKASHAQNVANGLYPLNDPVARARLCLSCHLGNEDKFVSHRMMAAGHPRMSFELDTFTQIQPAHFRIDADWQQRKGSWEPVRAWAIGQTVAAQEQLKLLKSPKRGHSGLFPELALFDCHACHHPMSERRNTASRLGAGPGAMRLNDASLLMVSQISRHLNVDGGAAIARQVSELHAAIASGDDSLLRASALEETLDKLVERIRRTDFSTRDMQAILAGLINDGLAGQFRDYQGAEQTTMAVQGLVVALTRQGVLRTAAVRPSMQRLMASVAHDEKYRPAEFERALLDLKRSLGKGTGK